MADAQEISGFFNSNKGDRKYLVAFFAEFFSNLIGNGVFVGGSYLKVEVNSGMTVKVLPGKGWINGYYYRLSGASKIIQLDPPDKTLSRIDRIVLRLDLTAPARDIRAIVKRGTNAGTPSVPVLTRNESVYELSLAEIRVNPNVTGIVTSNILDTRLNADLCGIVASIIDPLDLSAIFNQYYDFLINTQNAWASFYSTIQQNLPKYAQFDFDNKAAYPGAEEKIIIDGNGGIHTTKRNIASGLMIAERLTSKDSTGVITSTEVVYKDDGKTILRQTTWETYVDANGNIITNSRNGV